MNFYRIKVEYYDELEEGHPSAVCSGFVAAKSYAKAAKYIDKYFGNTLIGFEIYETETYRNIIEDTNIKEIFEVED